MDIILMYIVLSVNNTETIKINEKVIFESINQCSEYVFNNTQDINDSITRHMEGQRFFMKEIGCIDMTTEEKVPLKNQS